jgi:hypothetical protein
MSLMEDIVLLWHVSKISKTIKFEWIEMISFH